MKTQKTVKVNNTTWTVKKIRATTKVNNAGNIYLSNGVEAVPYKIINGQLTNCEVSDAEAFVINFVYDREPVLIYA